MLIQLLKKPSNRAIIGLEIKRCPKCHRMDWRQTKLVEISLLVHLQSVSCCCCYCMCSVVFQGSWQLIQTRHYRSAMFVTKPLSGNQAWLPIWQFIQVNDLMYVLCVTKPSVKAATLQLTWKFILRRSLIYAQLVGRRLNGKLIWLTIREYILAIAPISAMCATNHSLKAALLLNT